MKALLFQVGIFLVGVAVIFPACDICSLGIQENVGASGDGFRFLFPLFQVRDNQVVFAGVADAGISLTGDLPSFFLQNVQNFLGRRRLGRRVEGSVVSVDVALLCRFSKSSSVR